MKDVSLFIPCLVDMFLPEIGEATYILLRRLGVNPIYHKAQTCCGQPAINGGYIKQARKAAKHFIKVFGDDDVVVCPSGSCVHTVKYHYPKLLKDDARWLDRALALRNRIYEFSQYIVDILETSDVGASFSGKVTFHESCHNLRELGVTEQPKALIASSQGTHLLPLDKAEACCGFGGEFSFNFPSISEAIVGEKVERYVASGADLLILSEPGCLLNIGGYLSRHHPGKKAVHIASFLAGSGQEV